MERRYTVAEIDSMWKAVWDMQLKRLHSYPMSYDIPPEFGALVEYRLRTYVLAGVDPEDLVAAAARAE